MPVCRVGAGGVSGGNSDPLFRNHFKIYKEDTYANHFRHVLSSDQYLPTGDYITQVFALK